MPCTCSTSSLTGCAAVPDVRIRRLTVDDLATARATFAMLVAVFDVGGPGPC